MAGTWDLRERVGGSTLRENADCSGHVMTTNCVELTSHNPEQTQQIGFAIGELVQAGDLILLTGDLGAGKTCLTQGIAWGLGIDSYASSPSFVLVKEYQGRLILYHVDLYRLDSIEEIAELGISDFLLGGGICVVEWADKAMDDFSGGHLLVEFEHSRENERLLRFKPNGQRYVSLLIHLKEKWN